MTWSKVAESPCGTKWICIASTKPCVESVNRPNTVLDMLPGTEVTLLSESQDWYYGKVKSIKGKVSEEDLKGIFPKSFVVATTEVDPIPDRMKYAIVNVCRGYKHSWLEAKDDERQEARKQIQINVASLINNRRDRMRNMHKMSEGDLNEQAKTTRSLINQFPLVRDHGLIVDDELVMLTRHDDVTFSQLYSAQRDWQHKESNRCNLSEEENPHIMFSMSRFKPPAEQPTPFTNIKIMMAVFDRIHGFITPFYELDYSGNKKYEMKAECKKGFYVPLNIKDGDQINNLFFAVLIVDETETHLKRCKAAGTVKFNTIYDTIEKKEQEVMKKDGDRTEADEWELLEMKMSPTKDLNFTAIEIISKSLGDGHGAGSEKHYFNVSFKTKMVPASTLDENDSILDKVKIPSLLIPAPRINQISVSLEKAKMKGPIWMGDYFGVNIDVEVIDENGRKVACVKEADGREEAIYRSLVSPCNDKCDWREQFLVDLLAKNRRGKDGLRKSLGVKEKENNWKEYHLRFTIWKAADSNQKRKKRFGFSFLPFFSSGNIVRDQTHQLFVFQQDDKTGDPDPEEYLQKEFMYDAQMPNAALKKQKGSNFVPGQGSFLDVRTRVSSTIITEDHYINGLLSLDVDQAHDEQISDTFDQFINSENKGDSQAKRILFMFNLLDKFWSILKSQPAQKAKIFESFIETIRPLVMSEKDFGYAAKHLDDYLVNTDRFTSKEVFSAFIEAFSEFLTDRIYKIEGPKARYTMMSLKYIFQIIVQSYKINRKMDSKFDGQEFLGLMSVLRSFLLEDTGKRLSSTAPRNYGFKNLFEMETLDIISEIVPPGDLIDTLEALLEYARDKKDFDTLTMNVMSKVIQSNLFDDPESQMRICRIALNLGTYQLKREDRHKSVGAKKNLKESAFKEITIVLLKDLYEACKKPGPGEDARREFVKEITLEVLPNLTLLLPVTDAHSKESAGRGNGGKDEGRQGKKLDEVMFFTLLNEVDKELFDRILEQENSSSSNKENFFEHIFKLAIQADDFSFPEDSFRLQMISINHFIKFLDLVCAKGIMVVTEGLLDSDQKYDVAELFLKALSSLITSPNLALENFTKGKRRRVEKNFGDLRRHLAQIMRDTIRGMSKEDIRKLIEKELYSEKTHKGTLEALFTAITKTQEVEDNQNEEKIQAERNCLIGVVFEVLLAEFFAKEKEDEEGKVKISNDLSCCYTWFILQITAEKEYSNLRDSFFQKISEYLNNFEGSWKTREDMKETTDESVKAFVLKFARFAQLMETCRIKHLQELTTSARDVKRVRNRRGAREKSHQHYFGEVTSLYFKYKVVQKVKDEATEHDLIQQDDDERCLFKDECIKILQNLFDIFDRHTRETDENLGGGVEESKEERERKEKEKENDIKDDYISAGFTLGELSKLFDWSEEKKCNLRVNIWIRECLEMNKQNGPEIYPTKAIYTWSEAKEAITALAIKKFKDASGFECSVEMMEESIDRYKTEVFEFKELAKAYKALGEIYEYRVDFNNKLKDEAASRKEEMENARKNVINPTYFNISFYNTAATKHLRFLEGKSFIYRADAFIKPVDMWNMLEKWFPYAIIEKERIKDDKKKSIGGNKMTVECFLVEALLTNTKEFTGRTVPPHLFEYALKNTANMFYYKTAFEKVRNKENPISSTFTNNWVYETEFSLPGMLRWSEVIRQPQMQELSPIVTTVAMMQTTNWDYEMMLMRLKEDQNTTQVATNRLEQSLFGVILPSVGGGTPMIEKAFLTPEYAKENPEHKDLIEQLKNEIKKQVLHILKELLPIYKKRVEEEKDREAGVKAMEKFQKISEEHIESTYGPHEKDKMKFQDPVINQYLINF